MNGRAQEDKASPLPAELDDEAIVVVSGITSKKTDAPFTVTLAPIVDAGTEAADAGSPAPAAAPTSSAGGCALASSERRRFATDARRCRCPTARARGRSTRGSGSCARPNTARGSRTSSRVSTVCRGSSAAADYLPSRISELLERRLDNVVFRAGFARTIPAARQLVNHGHVLVDGKRVDIASYRVDKGQVLSLRPRSKDLAAVTSGFAVADTFQTSWLEVDRDARSAAMTSLPDETSALFPLRVQLVVEFYSQRL